jgi:heat shock protein HslJ
MMSYKVKDMNKRFLALTGAVILILAVLVVIFVQARLEARQAPEGEPASPQMLLIPRWFLNSLTLDGQVIDVTPDQQVVTIQFQEGGKANGTGSCNSFFADYGAGEDGHIKIGPVGSTKMACDTGMRQETAYFAALEKVERYEVADGQLRLFSADGKTEVVFRMPPK